MNPEVKEKICKENKLGNRGDRMFLYKGLHCYITRRLGDHLRGYVGVPKEYTSWYGKLMYELPRVTSDVVHGGITYSRGILPLQPLIHRWLDVYPSDIRKDMDFMSYVKRIEDSTWWIGFDTNHKFDYDFRKDDDDPRKYRDMNYVAGEVMSLADYITDNRY